MAAKAISWILRLEKAACVKVKRQKQLLRVWHQECAAFEQQVKPYLLYK